ncbi:hypothetical protein J7F03_24965 [Streptomyces sp. ISL-43]|uniref:hypothetical protein n=1 Tax=Streptomyces sp. ISL-43 TaxID=2819183 RepID=UPI001BEA458E|nr:hypothetical protein [Streptomyces sp. ISL-43]MBT2450269.1 hypothetical protein [Streptomyces sp. ISL-43]
MGTGQKAALDIGTGPEPEQEPGKKLDLSAAQVAGSSLATVAAALLASKMGVYGTILGAGVVSVVATAGGPVIQHFFRRTGDQLRESARPRGRQVPVDGGEERAPDGTMMLRQAAPPLPAGLSEEFGEATVHGSRVRGWKRTAVASAAAFALAIGGIAAYEAVSGNAVSSGNKTVWGGTAQNAGNAEPEPADESGTGDKGTDGTSPETGNSPSPSHPSGSPDPSPDPDSSPSPDPTPSPTPPKPDPTPTPTPTPPQSPTPSTGKATPGGASAGTGRESQTP